MLMIVIYGFQLTSGTKDDIIFSYNYDIRCDQESRIANESDTIINKELNLFREDSFIYLSADRISPDENFGVNFTQISKKTIG